MNFAIARRFYVMLQLQLQLLPHPVCCMLYAVLFRDRAFKWQSN